LNYSFNWGKQFSIVSNNIFISNTSLRNNLFYAGNQQDEKYNKVVEITGLSDIGPLDRIISSETISTGQKQRVAIARALLRFPSILILDEAINSLDPVSRNSMLGEIFNHCNKMTIILVSHFNVNGVKFDKVLDFNLIEK
jgi:ATP-binding cassette subfamily B protein/ATP-binding cassette subfamily C protein/ATP-binding cassette subfamily B multidrug efflux pump